MQGVAIAGRTLKVRFNGDEALAARLLTELVGRGSRSAASRAVAADLEDAFLKVTQGRLQ
ncbi:MAG: hypothetical protein HY901_33625 [Deltaproteobacteria bacterium]|nr:hypothetical protein [Deltaproteobacteria bacterium]